MAKRMTFGKKKPGKQEGSSDFAFGTNVSGGKQRKRCIGDS